MIPNVMWMVGPSFWFQYLTPPYVFKLNNPWKLLFSEDYSYQVFFTFDLAPTAMTPIWMFNESIGAGWLHVPFQLRHPAQMPSDLRGEHVVGLEQTGPPEQLLNSAIRAGVFLTVPQLKSIHDILKFNMPAPNGGHGKGGRWTKLDWAECLVAHLFDNESKETQLDMVRGIMGQNWRHLDSNLCSKHSADIIKAFNGLEGGDQKEFTKLMAVAMDEMCLKEKRETKPRVEGTAKKERQHETPQLLQDLCPLMQGCRISRHPALKRYQGFYTTYNDAGAFCLFFLL